MCISRSYLNKPDYWFADQIGMDHSHFSQCLKVGQKRPKHFPAEKTGMLQAVCGNRAPTQWIDMVSTGDLDIQRERKSAEQEIEELQARISELKQTA